jgi:large subunit ribosomal protein L4
MRYLLVVPVSFRKVVMLTALQKALSTSFARSITTSTNSKAAVSPITTSAGSYVPVTPFAEQKVLVTIHQFPTLEPLRLESYPANHLYLPTRRDILHRAVVFEGDATRLGTASTKTRYEVHGSARKIRPQKGSGRARLGDKKSPMLRGGGVAHGPHPRDFSTDLPQKVYDLAWRTALSYRFRKGELIVVDNEIELESPSQGLLSHIFDLHDKERGKGRSLLITRANRPLLEQALDKMDRRRQVLTYDEVDVKDLLELSRIIIERSALRKILLTHQHDLTNNPQYPAVQQEAPYSHHSTPGWSNFLTLVQAAPAEREAMRPDVYESTAADRLEAANSLSDENSEKYRLKSAAYQLVAEAKELRRKQLSATGPLSAEYTELEDNLARFGDPAERKRGLVPLYETLVRWRDINYQSVLLEAEVAENKREAELQRGQKEAAEELQSIAGDLRTDVERAELELFEAHNLLHMARADVCILEGDEIGALEEQRLAQEMQEQVERLGGFEDEEFDVEDEEGGLQAENEEGRLHVENEKGQKLTDEELSAMVEKQKKNNA